jgi:hypothetical protein
MNKVKFRIGFETEEEFNPENSNIREKDGVITYTFRG